MKSIILSNRNIKGRYFEIIIRAPEIAAIAKPGQFVNVKVSDGLEPLLRRPLSIHKAGGQRKAKDSVVLLYEVVGKGTEILSGRKSQELLDVIGPLGNGFTYYPLSLPCRQAGAKRYPLILVAGGMGTAPLVFLAEKIAAGLPATTRGAGRFPRDYARGKQATVKPLVLIGAKTKKDILCEEEFRDLGCEVKIATDDGSRGFKGYISELLKQELSAKRYPCLAGRQALSAIYGCGPAPMLKEISLISRKCHLPAQISLEAHMACGIGACMGCVVKTQNAKRKTQNDFVYKRVCKDGPVFEASQVIWE